MSLTTSRTPQLVNRINTRFRNSPVWNGLYAAVDTVIKEVVTAPREDLQTIRDSRRKHRGDWLNLPDGRRGVINSIVVNSPTSTDIYAQILNSDEVVDVNVSSNLKDRQLLINNCVRKGFNYLSDTLSTEDYARINDWVEYFWPQSGTDNYYRFMGFIKNMRLHSDVLWTSDQGDLNSSVLTPGVLSIDPDGTLHNTVEEAGEGDFYPYLEPNYGQYKSVTDGGDSYQTSHVQLRYDPLVYPDTNETDLYRLFYLLAPIQLVLQRIATEIDGDAALLVTHVHGKLTEFESGRAHWDYDTQIRDLLWLEMGKLSQYESGRAIYTYQTLEQINVAASTGFSFSCFFRDGFAGAVFIDPSRFVYQMTISDVNNVPILVASNANGRLYHGDNLSLACSIPASVYAPIIGGTYSYVLQRASINDPTAWRTYFTGPIVVQSFVDTATNLQDLFVNLSTGFSFSGIFYANGAPVVQSGYEFKLDIINDPTVVIEATDDNGRLYTGSGGQFACFIPPEVAPINPSVQYSYILYRKLTTDPDTAYQSYVSGLIIVENA